MRETDAGPTPAGLRMLRGRVVPAGPGLLRELALCPTRLLCYSNRAKNAHAHDRARAFALRTNQRLYWSVARDMLRGPGALAPPCPEKLASRFSVLGTMRRVCCFPRCKA